MPPKRNSTSYTNDHLHAAVAEVKNGKKIRATAKKYNIPYTTLNDKVNGRVPISRQKSGPSSYLSSSQEDRLASYLITMTKIGYGLDRKEVPGIVKEILDQAEEEGYLIPESKKFVDNRSVKIIFA